MFKQNNLILMNILGFEKNTSIHWIYTDQYYIHEAQETISLKHKEFLFTFSNSFKMTRDIFEGCVNFIDQKPHYLVRANIYKFIEYELKYHNGKNFYYYIDDNIIMEDLKDGKQYFCDGFEDLRSLREEIYA